MTFQLQAFFPACQQLASTKAPLDMEELAPHSLGPNWQHALLTNLERGNLCDTWYSCIINNRRQFMIIHRVQQSH